MLSYKGMKRIRLCDDNGYYVTDEDADKLKQLSPGIARLVRECEDCAVTHFVCELCGQIAPVKLRGLHKCFR